jgi:hypothetical protein
MCEGRTKAGLEGVELLQLDVVELESKCEELNPKPNADDDPPPVKQNSEISHTVKTNSVIYAW